MIFLFLILFSSYSISGSNILFGPYFDLGFPKDNSLVRHLTCAKERHTVAAARLHRINYILARETPAACSLIQSSVISIADIVSISKEVVRHIMAILFGDGSI